MNSLAEVVGSIDGSLVPYALPELPRGRWEERLPDDPDRAFVLEAVYEGFLLHYREPRAFAGMDSDMRLLAGDALIDVLVGPDNYRALPDLLERAAAGRKGLAVDLSEYAAGSALARAGVISGSDMTAEAALAKLYYLFSRGYSVEKVKREMQRNLRGEMTAS